MVLDPVCRIEVEEQAAPGGKAQYWGETVFFCSSHCRAAFQREPQKYVKQPEEGVEPGYDPRMFLGDM